MDAHTIPIVRRLIFRQAKRREHEHRQAELEQMYAAIYGDDDYKQEQTEIDALFAPALQDGLDTPGK